MNLKTMNWTYTNNVEFFSKIVKLFNTYNESFILSTLYKNESFKICYKRFKKNIQSTDNESVFLEICNKIDSYFSYVDSVLALKKLFSNKDNYTLEERREIINNAYDNYDELINTVNIQSITSEHINSLFGHRDTYIYLYKELRNYSNDKINVKKYNDSKSLIYEMLSFFRENSYKTTNNSHNYVTMRDYFIKENISKQQVREAVETFEETYLISFVNDETIPLFNEYSIDDFYGTFSLLKRIYEMSFNEKYIVDGEAKHHIKSEEEIYKLFMLLKKYMKESNNTYQILYKLLIEENYTYKLLNESACSFYQYVDKNITHIKEKDSYKDLYRELIALNRTLKNVTKGVYEIIVSNDEKKEINKQISFDILYYYRISPHRVQSEITETTLYKKYEDEALNYLREYKAFFTKNEDEKLMNIEEEEKQNIPKFETIILDYINSKIHTIKEYCESINIEEKEFKYMINILNKYESSVYTKYTENIEVKQKQRMAVIMTKLTKMICEMVNAKGKFSLLDYYDHTSLKLTQAHTLIKDTLSPEQKKVWNKFLRVYEGEKELNEAGINSLLYNLKVKYCVEMDNKGNILKCYEVTKADKEQTLLMLKEKNIPITNATFSLMLKKYYEENILPSLTNNKNKNI